MVPAKGLATSVLTDPLFTWEVPDEWSLEDAATVPIVYATVSQTFRTQYSLYSSRQIKLNFLSWMEGYFYLFTHFPQVCNSISRHYETMKSTCKS